MKRVLPPLLLLLICRSAWAADTHPGLPALLAKMSATLGDRWEVTVTGDMIYVNSKQEVLGEAAGYSFGPGEKRYRLHFRFKVVSPVTASQAAESRQQLKALRKKAESVRHTESKGYFRYEPHGEAEWDLVLKVQKAEKTVEDIPEYRAGSVYLSEDYSMRFFIPNKQNKGALLHKADIERLFGLLEKVTPN